MTTQPTDLQNELPPVQDGCCPVFIKYFEGYTYREIAEALNLPLSTVKERLRKNKRLLRINLRIFARYFMASVGRED